MDNIVFSFAPHEVEPGTKQIILFPAPHINTQIKIDIPVHVFNGRKSGPKLFIIGCIHGDELNSIEIIRRVHQKINPQKLSGTLITVPVANIYGVIMLSRYLPDGRDLNRFFPGSKKGTLAARLAQGIIKQVVSYCDYGIDLHTGALGRLNLPQLRVDLSIPGTEEFARSFDTPIILDAKQRDGSLRNAANEMGIPLLVYEGGEALRFNELCIRAGVRGIMNVLDYLNMYRTKKKAFENKSRSVITQTSRWIRAPASGLVQPLGKVIATAVKKDDLLGYIHDPFLMNPSEEVRAPFDGIVIGQTLRTMASEGDALYHIASFSKLEGVTAHIEEFQDEITRES